MNYSIILVVLSGIGYSCLASQCHQGASSKTPSDFSSQKTKPVYVNPFKVLSPKKRYELEKKQSKLRIKKWKK